MKSLFKDASDEFIEKKSRFIGHAFVVKTEEEAISKIEYIKSLHKDATHNCSAYIIGSDKLIQRYNDDGEPSGTAGVPMLEVLKKEDLTDVVLIVTRYFGGIMLGAGGLVRAYTKAAKLAVDSGIIVEMVEHDKISISYDYTFHGSITNYLIKNDYKILKEDYTDKVKISVYKRFDDKRLTDDIVDMTSSLVEFETEETLKLPMSGGKILYR